ncbi:hypothetical protein HYY73_03320 [Candidatus Woesearchaeota archaeon]|nr:hypothetical protein [Candidatus Woesearchaeota archaeon]
MVVQTFLAIGNACIDSTSSGKRAGGSVLYSAVAAKKLGWNAVIATNFASDYEAFMPLLEGLKVIRHSRRSTTTFGISYSGGSRQMTLEKAGEKLDTESLLKALAVGSVNPDILFFCPVAGEYSSDLVSAVTALYPESLVVVTPQGWMRQWLREGNAISLKEWAAADEVLPLVDVLVLSEEDVGGNGDVLGNYEKLIGKSRGRGFGSVVVLTHGERGATARSGVKEVFSPAFKAKTVDPTGAGDVFAAAFAIMYYETTSVEEALTLAHSAAAFTVEGKGPSNIPTRQMVEGRQKSDRFLYSKAEKQPSKSPEGL